MRRTHGILKKEPEKLMFVAPTPVEVRVSIFFPAGSPPPPPPIPPFIHPCVFFMFLSKKLRSVSVSPCTRALGVVCAHCDALRGGVGRRKRGPSFISRLETRRTHQKHTTKTPLKREGARAYGLAERDIVVPRISLFAFATIFSSLHLVWDCRIDGVDLLRTPLPSLNRLALNY